MLKIVCEDGKVFMNRTNESNREADIVRIFRNLFASNGFDQIAPFKIDQTDTVVYEMAFKFGRADIVIFHIDGSATVIEVKDGSKGYNHVVSGIGQCSLYASQIQNLPFVRRCLLWSATSSLAQDVCITKACEVAGVIPFQFPLLYEMVKKEHIAIVLNCQHSQNDYYDALEYACDLLSDRAKYLSHEKLTALEEVMSRCIKKSHDRLIGAGITEDQISQEIIKRSKQYGKAN